MIPNVCAPFLPIIAPKTGKAIDRIISQIEKSGHPPLISVPAILSSTLTIHGLALFLLMPPVTSEI